MKKIVALVAVGIIGIFGVAHAQTFSDETIVSYLSDITVNTDNSIAVMETIVYNTGPSEHHGIYRDIRTTSSQKRTMAISQVSVVDEQGRVHPFTTSRTGDTFRVKIGDPDVTFSGQKTYIIRYHATRAVAQLDDVDELYWNVTGNEWAMPILKAQATVHLPVGASVTQSACYYGASGSTTQCTPTTRAQATVFVPPGTLDAYQGLTVAAGFAKGVVVPYTKADDAANFFATYWPWMVSALLPLITLVLSLWYWYRKGRDPKGTGVIVPQYDTLDHLTPMEIQGIVNERVAVKDISAQIIALATQGYLKIREVENVFLGLIKTKDYELERLKDAADAPNGFDQVLLNGLFADGAKTVKLSALRNKFYKDAAKVRLGVVDALKSKGYYSNLGRMKTSGGRAVLLTFMSIWGSLFFGSIVGAGLFHGNPLPLIASIFLSVMIYGIVSHFNPAKTQKGVDAKEYLQGLKVYLQIAEKDRLLFHNAPEKKPEVFEKLLPFAMALGVADIWAKEFKDIYTTPPSWYVGSPGSSFNTLNFTHSLNSFSSFASSSLASSPSSSGSGGGGSSGGGGGGGGGGSW